MLLDLPIPEIAPHALLRDRTALDPAALHLLQHSIATEGLRTPIEVWQLATPAMIRRAPWPMHADQPRADGMILRPGLPFVYSDATGLIFPLRRRSDDLRWSWRRR